MSQLLKIYNSDEFDVIFGTVIVDEGKADGEFARLESESDITEDVAGTDGEVALSRLNDERATLTVLLMATSSKNDEFSVYANLARTSPGMAGAVVPVFIKDRNGRTVMEGANAWVRRAPDRSWDRTVTTNEWQIRIAHLKRFDGGN